MPLARMLLLVFILLLGTAAQAEAHPLDAGSSTLHISGRQATYELYLPESMLLLFDGDRNRQITQEELQAQQTIVESYLRSHLSLETVDRSELDFRLLSISPTNTPSSAGYTFTMSFTAAHSIEGLYIRYELLFDDLTPNHTNLLVIPKSDGRFDELLFDRYNRVSYYEAAQSSTLPALFSRYFLLGVHHILQGYDHLLFLFSLLLAAATIRSCLGIITAFTISHSITLCLTAIGAIHMLPQWTESLIALSIGYVAMENMLRKQLRRRWIVTFLFGFIHGMGFAGALGETGLPNGHLGAVLLAFNGGIEFGQIGLVVIAFPFLLRLRQYTWFPKLAYGLSASVAVVALYWLIERLGGSPI